MAAYFRRHNDGASVAAILAEAAYGGYRSEIEGGAPCIDKRLKKAIFPPFERDGRGSAELFYGLYFALAHNPGFDRARAGGLLGCSDFRYDAHAWRPAASEALEGGCAIPFAWTRRGLQKSELCLDIQVYALVLAMWTVSGGEPVNEDAFVNMVRYLSEQAPEHPSAKGSAAPPQCKR
jgi:hypothetical protein